VIFLDYFFFLRKSPHCSTALAVVPVLAIVCGIAVVLVRAGGFRPFCFSFPFSLGLIGFGRSLCIGISSGIASLFKSS
jgi:hypothetical protein